MSRAGLGLSLHDLVHGSNFRTAFDSWWDYAKRNYAATMYYDPLLDHHHPGALKFTQAHGLLPLYSDDARVLFETHVDQLSWRGAEAIGSGAMRARVSDVIMGMFLAREFGDEALYARLKAYSEANYEPTWDTDTGEFTWGFGLKEEYPRGQLNATAAMAEAASSGAWSGLLNQPKLRRFLEPTVYGVDFPKVCLSQATYDVDRRLLAVATDAGAPLTAGEPTTFRVTNVVPEHCVVEADGVLSDDWRVVDGDLEVSTTVGTHTFIIRCNR